MKWLKATWLVSDTDLNPGLFGELGRRWAFAAKSYSYVNVSKRTPETHSGVASRQHQASIIIELKNIIILLIGLEGWSRVIKV